MNVGKEANPMKDDNGMNKQNNDTVAPEVNDNSGTDSLKGPWMHVTPEENLEMMGKVCGVMPGKMNVGKEANPMKDDNGMNKQNNDTVAPEVNDNSGTDSLKGPWMHVTPEENLEMMVRRMQMGKALLLKPTVATS
ncbi:hypothetical protein L3X38_009802 [Prunus dulcis]|uniref:Uncharacterized protein n=1 Tax=Prunus dulcis TaxID=3755 RepID=A0AAD4WH42_PRUDU|nr:hypothetical protein L3X38_009802 [Prunus dulcis]